MKELTIVERVDELAVKSGKELEFDVTELSDLADKAKKITSIEDESFKEVKAEMVKKRTYIKQYCLDSRRDIKKVAEGVSEIEDMLYEIFVPQENRLIDISKADKAAKLLEERKEVLPKRLEKLKSIEDGVEVSEEELLGMDSAAFEGYFNQRLSAKNAADREEIEKKEAEIKEKQEKIDQEKETQEREEKARKEGAKKAKQEAKDKADKLVADAKEKEEKEASEAKAKEEAEAEDKRKLAASNKFQEWLKEQGYSEETKKDFKLVDLGDEIKLYKLVGNYKK